MGEQWECLEMADETDESLWVRIRGQTNMDNIMMTVCYRLLDQEDVGEAFFSQLEEASCSQALVLLRDSACAEVPP